jgi:hypothetical protein
MELVSGQPNVELRRAADGAPIVVLAFPYDAHIVAVVRTIPHRRFDWDRREWWAPADDWSGVHVAEVLARFPELTTSPEVDAWLAGLERTWVGRITTARHDARGWFALHRRAGTLPEALEERSHAVDGALLVPLELASAEAIEGLGSARLDGPARRCLAVLLGGDEPPPARLRLARDVEGERLRLDVLWDHDAGAAFDRLPGVDDVAHALPLDPWVVEPLDAFLALHGVPVEASARPALERLRAEHAQAAAAVRRSRATAGEPIPATAAVLGGELGP